MFVLREAVAATAAAIVTMSVFMAAPAAAHEINAGDFQQVTLAKGEPEVGEPMSLAVLPDRSVLHTARNGTLRRTDAAGTTGVVGTLPVYNHDEEGLQGVGVDPGFATNRFIYLYYAPPLSTPAGDSPDSAADFSAWQGVNRLSRFTLTADWKLSAEKTILDVPASRGICCHVGGDIDFDAAGNLYLSTGDDSNPSSPTGTPRSTNAPTATRPSTPSAAQATPTICAARSSGSKSTPTERTRCRPATCSRPAPPGPAPRSTPWASATRSG
ncbi:hypothetical protein Ato02nite_016890 [Paractinoplanes toevensis]|uniref:Glucose/Sorbosone dehydrogenase domain-containing protein n=1 Tax=Paractinoplanes toevensis TaxID=571911 RepID=A0A919T889_9ACTN|nr:hypothetical protein Ato02nite_016890 [Actinoplanes toevensis]